jgi:Golgi phosphoprotein 3
MTAQRPLHLHEQVLLLALNREKGTSTTGFEHIAIAGAVLAGWLLEGRISIDPSRKQLVSLASVRTCGDPVLDECLDLIKATNEPARLRTWIARLSRIPRLRHKVAMQLCARGILRADEDKVLWVFPRKIYPEINPRPRKALVENLHSAIFSGTVKPDERLAVLISLAYGAGLLAPLFGRREIRQHQRQISALIASNLVGTATQEFIATYRTIAAASGAATAAIAAS